jgi:PAS domain S-box-containing protein
MTSNGRIWAWAAVLGAGAIGVTTLLAVRHPVSAHGSTWALLPLFVALMTTAERLRVRVRIGREVDGVNLVEAILAPMLFAFSGLLVVGVTAVTLLISSAIRRASKVNLAFNVAQWSLAAGAASLVFDASRSRALDPPTLARLVGALAVVAVVNDVAVLVVLALARGRSPWSLAVEMRRVVAVAWGGGWVLNVLIGLLYVAAYVGHPATTALFAVPLVVLHIAYRGFAVARGDQQRLASLHRAAQTLAGRADPHDGISEFLSEVAACYSARAAILVIRGQAEREVHVWDGRRDPAYDVTTQDNDEPTLEGALAALPAALYIQPRDRHQLAGLLREHGWRDCLSAPMLDDGRHTGCLAVFDQDGVEGSPTGQLAILEALGRETSGTFAKGRLFAEAVEQRRRLEEVMGAMSDGMLSIAADGTVLSWNRALEAITGIPSAEAVGRTDTMVRLQPEDLGGTPIDLARWRREESLPTGLRITTADGAQRRLECSYSLVTDEDDEPSALVVVARDVTTHEQMAALREEYTRLSEEQAASREVVEQLQQAVVPPAPAVGDVQLAVEYISSDTNAPTGGDLYDWQLLPGGDLHLAVVDVLGHGVSATKAALSVVHTLRIVASEGLPMEEIIGRADTLLSSQDPDLAATAVVARYTPATGQLRVVSGGHPPALVLHPDGRVSQVTATGGAIGWPGAGSDKVSTLTLDEGDTLLLYTDGLVEARKNLLQGLEDLTAHAAHLVGLPAHELPAALVSRILTGAQRRDDTLALVLRRTAGEPGPTFTRAAGPGAAEAVRLRRELAAWVGALDRDGDALNAVAAELLANAARFARSSVIISASLEGPSVRLCVSDDGPGDAAIAQRGETLPEDDALAGRGLFMVRTLSSDVSFMSSSVGTTVTATVPVSSSLPHQKGSGMLVDRF